MTGFKRVLLASALAACVAVPLLSPAPAQAWWVRPGGGWHGGWHAGWGWRGGVYVGVPGVVVAPPVGYAPPPAYPYRWVPGHYEPNGAFVPAHWGYY